MKTNITTIEELQGKPVSELHAVFRKASEIAHSEGSLPRERETARATMDNVKRVLASRATPGW